MSAHSTRPLRDAIAAFRERHDGSLFVRLSIGLALVLLIAMLFPKGLSKFYEYAEGSVWNEGDLIASFAFPIYRNPMLVQEEQREAIRATPASFDRVDSIPGMVKDSMLAISGRLAALIDAEIAASPRKIDAAQIAVRARMLTLKLPQQAILLPLSVEDMSLLMSMRMQERRGAGRTPPFRDVLQPALRVVDDVYRRGYLDKMKNTFAQPMLALSTPSHEELLPLKAFLDKAELQPYILARLEEWGVREPFRIHLITSFLRPMLPPNIVQNAARTQIAFQAAEEKVPRMDGIVKQNERIVSRHERVTSSIKAKLDSYQRARNERTGEVNTILQFLGRAGHTSAILFVLLIYLSLFRKRIIRSNTRLMLLALILFMQAFLAYLSFTVPLSGPVQYLILVPVASMLVAMLFDSRVAFYTTVTVAFLVGALRGNDYGIILASTVAGSMALYTVRDIKHRTQIFRSLTYIFIGYAATILFDGLQRSVPYAEVTTALGYAFANAVISPILTFGLLYFFERLFGIDTDLTLLELSDFNQPLLRELSARAPGTFHHSIVMGTLAEAAAASIGANSTLARVGAYYHDIGKIAQPGSFVENLKGAPNVHETLQPRDSAARIIRHVEEGMALAREARLPQRIIDFIPAHHGTSTVAYFLEKEKAEHPDGIDETEFRYPGPKPVTKETAIVMLADTIEAATRALEEPTVEKIERLIDSITAKRLDDGQLAESDLTFRDLSKVKKSFLNILTGIHHSRIKYPTEDEAEAARKIAERTAKLLKLPTTTEALTQRIKKLDL
ncbi:MAG: HDIG domain-containing protein [Ignavibacteria bacterium]|nr:HDIG domain-containing protein [Ignavibacteria bacterium]